MAETCSFDGTTQCSPIECLARSTAAVETARLCDLVAYQYGSPSPETVQKFTDDPEADCARFLLEDMRKCARKKIRVHTKGILVTEATN